MRQATPADGLHPQRGNFLTPVYLFVAGQKRWRALALAAALGVFANLAFPPIWFWPAMAVSLTGMIWSMDAAKLAAKPKTSVFWRFFAFGYAYFLVGLHWIAAAFMVDASDLIFIWMPLVALPAGLALLLAGFMTICFQVWCAGPARLILFSVAFMLSEWFRSSLFGIGGLPWNLLGMVWAPGGAISQSASVWGIYGLSLLTIIALASPATLADSRARGTTGSRAAPIVVAAVVFGMIWGWGAKRLSDIKPGPPGEMVRLVEAGASEHEKHQASMGPLVVQRFRELTGADGPNSPKIVIWPEGALPYLVFERPDVLDAVTEELGTRKLIFGLARREDANTKKEKTYNSLAVLSANSQVTGPQAIYDKHMLVPFGEFFPGGNLVTAMGLKTLQDLAPGGFAPGPTPATIRTLDIPPFAPLICYEAIFPGFVPQGGDRPRWMVNISNDAWFGNLSGPPQHAAQARYRAIEEGLPMARVASKGQTGMIDLYGRWTARGAPADPAVYGPDPPRWTSSVVDAVIPPAAAPTSYGRWRDGLYWIMLLTINLAFIALPRR